ncbi:MAG: molybdopterin-dependent oxidoreductase [Acidobacteriaceae bacterium]|jgi:DMSO/TMAO reductase YedYZ molybdopterin-dependent catalytic subunit|nr:molybdopterin-dependent oxidoreductase [Acidobacteriaceae bacterium]
MRAMSNTSSRRALLKQLGFAGLGLSLAELPVWALPPLGAGDVVAQFTDYPASFNPTPTPQNRTLDLRTMDGVFTPKDRFFAMQHYGHPQVDLAAFRLKVGGLVNKPLTLSLDDLKKMRATDLVAGFECSGNSPRSMQGLSGNGKWTGVPLRAVLDQAGVKAEAREFVFFGADHGQEEIEWRTQKFTLEQQFGRSLTREHALSPEPMLVWALNGEPLTVHQGAPLRLIVPGWYGVANVKWLTDIYVQDEAFLGKFQTRWYRTLRGETINGETKWVETAVTRMRVKSFIARVTTNGNAATVHGFVLSDGTSVKSVEVNVDGGAWQPATIDSASVKDKYGWKIFSYTWNNPTPGDHTLVSRATDANGIVQPTAKDLENKKSFLEDNSQFVRKVKIG